jgi:hypothetical protein
MNKPPLPPSPPVRQLGMHSSLLQDQAVINHSGRNIHANVDGQQHEADRDGCNVPCCVNSHQPSLWDMGLDGRDDDTPHTPHTALAGPCPGWWGRGFCLSTNVDAVKGQGYVGCGREEPEQCILEYIGPQCCDGHDSHPERLRPLRSG